MGRGHSVRPTRLQLGIIDRTKIGYMCEMKRPGILGILLKRIVEPNGFEAPASWSRTRYETLLNCVESY
jgi:hypothetical protein